MDRFCVLPSFEGVPKEMDGYCGAADLKDGEGPKPTIIFSPSNLLATDDLVRDTTYNHTSRQSRLTLKSRRIELINESRSFIN